MHSSSRRPNRIVRPIVAIGTAALLGLGLPAAHAADLTVEVLGARSAQGSVAGALFANGASWLKNGESVQVQVVPASDKAVIVFRDVAPGRYAVSAYHDENGNGKLDANFIGLPTEPYGFSRDAKGRMGPPDFDGAAVDLQSDTTIQIHLR